ncbi:MAG TPA: hypothetical protein VIG51_01680 [Candidatus Baltobacteraceae bacterium]|jgi:hypothetical protein
MHPSAGSPQYGANAVILVIVVAMLVWRNLRPQKISVGRLFVTPILLAIVVVFSIYGTQSVFPIPPWQIAIALIVGVLAGIPVGLLRGHHSRVRATERRNVMLLDASWQTMAIYLGAFLVRYLLRLAFPPFSPAGAAIGDGVLAFAAAMLIVSYYAIYTKYKALEGATLVETPAPQAR